MQRLKFCPGTQRKFLAYMYFVYYKIIIIFIHFTYILLFFYFHNLQYLKLFHLATTCLPEKVKRIGQKYIEYTHIYIHLDSLSTICVSVYS